MGDIVIITLEIAEIKIHPAELERPKLRDETLNESSFTLSLWRHLYGGICADEIALPHANIVSGSGNRFRSKI